MVIWKIEVHWVLHIFPNLTHFIIQQQNKQAKYKNAKIKPHSLASPSISFEKSLWIGKLPYSEKEIGIFYILTFSIFKVHHWQETPLGVFLLCLAYVFTKYTGGWPKLSAYSFNENDITGNKLLPGLQTVQRLSKTISISFSFSLLTQSSKKAYAQAETHCNLYIL